MGKWLRKYDHESSSAIYESSGRKKNRNSSETIGRSKTWEYAVLILGKTIQQITSHNEIKENVYEIDKAISSCRGIKLARKKSSLWLDR